MERKVDVIEFKIEKRLATLGESKGGWSTELNLVSWNGREAKLDVRAWDPAHQHMGKGIAFTREEAAKLHEALGQYLGTST